MGVERAVTRWYVQRQLLLTEIETLSAKIEPLPSNASEENMSEVAPLDVAEMDEVVQQLARAQEKLHLLGPCPKPMMG
jgi:hypothetical protein